MLRNHFVFKISRSQPLFVYFPSFSHHTSNISWKDIDALLGIRTRGCKMDSTDGSAQEWLWYSCVQCSQEYKGGNVLYYHLNWINNNKGRLKVINIFKVIFCLKMLVQASLQNLGFLQNCVFIDNANLNESRDFYFIISSIKELKRSIL